MLPAAHAGTLFIDHSTIAPQVSEEFGKSLASKGFRFVDAPITGGSMGAQAGKLTIFLGGAEGDVAEALEIIKAYTKRAERVGPSGAGQWMKMANQIAVGGALAGLCECLNFAQKAGLDISQAKDLIGGGAGGSWAFDNYGPKILNNDWSPGFTVVNQRKDFAYCAEAAKSIEAAIPVTLVLDQCLGELESSGRGELTTAALYALLQEKKG
jgi:3-hydroxyisobutyrate dehydrogenase-like beta-hydroxyacid dehydrogenase